ncbi:MAG: hypothetical protein ACM3SY_13515 [Candidatus Omnitrophota bacterium]
MGYEISHVTNIWDFFNERLDVQYHKPNRKSSECYEVCKQWDPKNGDRYIIKDVTNDSYVSLSSEEFFVWELIGADNTVKDICVAFFARYKKISNMPLKLIRSLEEKNMLAEQWWDIYKTVNCIQRRGFKEKWRKIYSLFLDCKFSVKNIDGMLKRAYDTLGWVFLRREAIYIYCIFIVSGLWTFFAMGYFQNRLSLRNFTRKDFALWVGFLFSILPVLFHELGHAFACKKYGRKVNKAGLMLYVGLPILFVDTTDIWMKAKRQRIIVSLAGPFTDLLFGSICFLTHACVGDYGIVQLFPIVGLVAYLRCLYNLNPLLEFDGYYILIDALGIPGLRKKSFDFVLKEGIRKLLKREKLKREEYIFLFYGSLSLVYTYWMIFFVLYLWQTQIRFLLSEIWAHQYKSIYSQMLIIATLAFLFIRFSFIARIIFKKIESSIKYIYLKYQKVKEYKPVQE